MYCKVNDESNNSLLGRDLQAERCSAKTDNALSLSSCHRLHISARPLGTGRLHTSYIRTYVRHIIAPIRSGPGQASQVRSEDHIRISLVGKGLGSQYAEGGGGRGSNEFRYSTTRGL